MGESIKDILSTVEGYDEECYNIESILNDIVEQSNRLHGLLEIFTERLQERLPAYIIAEILSESKKELDSRKLSTLSEDDLQNILRSI